MLNAYWLSDETLPQAVSLKDISAPLFQIMSSDTIRVSPINSDLLLVSANYLSAPAGAPLTPRVWRRVLPLRAAVEAPCQSLPPNQWGRAAEWSRDSLQVFFAGWIPRIAQAFIEFFGTATGLQRWLTGSDYVVGSKSRRRL